MRNPQCKLCDRYKSAQSICVHGLYPDNKSIMIIIDTVSSATDNTGIYSSGQGGTFLSKLLAEAKILDQCYVTSAVKCFYGHKPLAKEWKACRKYLIEEIKQVNPKLIICLGNVAASGIFGKSFPVKDLRQRFFECPDFPSVQVAVTFSHNVVFTDPGKVTTLTKDLKWIVNNFNKKTSELDYQIHINKNIPESNIYGIDIETTGLNPYVDKLLTIAIADPISKICIGINVSHPKGDYTESELIEHIKLLDILNNPNIILVGHNIKFDIKFIEQYFKIKVKCKLFDTAIMHALIDENSNDNQLKQLAAIYTDLGHYEDDLDITNLINEPFEKVIYYNCLDAITPLKLIEFFWPELNKQGLINIFNFITEMISIFSEIEQTGIEIDIQKIRQLFIQSQNTYTEIANKYFKFNLNSDPQVKNILYGILKLPVLSRTKKNAPSTSKDALKELLSLDIDDKRKEVIKDILEHRKAEKMIDHYSDIIKHMYNSRVYTTYNLAKSYDESGVNRGTVTGRLSSSKAQLHNKPTDPEFRSVFIKSKNYKYFGTADYSQIELRVAAFLSRDPNLINAFEKNRDIHTSVLCDIQGWNYEEVNNILENKLTSIPEYQTYSDYRLVVKRVNFGILYGIGAKHLVKIIRQMGVELKEEVVLKIISDWKTTNTILMKWIRETEDIIIRDQQYKTIFGRIRHLPGASRRNDLGQRILRQGINFPIQSAASDICLLGIRELYNRFKSFPEKLQSRLLMTVHDEISFETKIEIPNTIKDIVQDCMVSKVKEKMLNEFGINFDIPLEVDVNISEHWSK